jgi:hypothetical protein
MKIAVMICRPWTVVHRFQSLLRNAKAEILCIGPKLTDRTAELTRELCDGLGLPLVYPTDRDVVYQALNQFNPDAIYGEAMNVPFEIWAQQWAAEHGKAGLVLDHTQFSTGLWTELIKPFPNSTMMAAHAGKTERYHAEGIKAVTVGMPDLDLIADAVPILKGDKVLALFINQWWYDDRCLQEDERSILKPLLQLANEEGWKVYIHTHASERSSTNSSGPEGLLFPQRYDYLMELQNWGGHFVGDYAGRIGDLEFLPINSLDLMLSANCIVGTSSSPWWKACALGKKYIYVQVGKWPLGNYIMPTINVEFDGPPLYTLVRHTMKSNSIDMEIPREFIDNYFMGLDGKCWKRMLEVVG